jgi:hypothetical protein
MRYKKGLLLLKTQKGFKELNKKPLLQRILSDCQLLKFPRWIWGIKENKK